MYVLLGACQHPAVLRLLYFSALFLDIITIIIPIGLILILLIDFTKAIMSSGDENLKSTKLVAKRIMFALIVFAVPWIINVFMSTLSSLGIDAGTDYVECLNNAKSGNFEYYDILLEAEEDANKIPANNPQNGTPSSGDKYEQASNMLLASARNELSLNIVGGSKYSGRSNSVPWCGYFVKWNMQKITIEGEGTLYDYHLNGETASNSYGAYVGDYVSTFYKNPKLEFYNSKYYGGNYTPKKGDLIFFWWLSKSHDYKHWDKTQSQAVRASHIGFVDYIKDGRVYVIEGNAGGKGAANNTVMEKDYSLGDDRIMGYGSWYK